VVRFGSAPHFGKGKDNHCVPGRNKGWAPELIRLPPKVIGIPSGLQQSSAFNQSGQSSTAQKNIQSEEPSGHRNELGFSILVGHDKPNNSIMQS
jgi:hypothetical protein